MSLEISGNASIERCVSLETSRRVRDIAAPEHRPHASTFRFSELGNLRRGLASQRGRIERALPRDYEIVRFDEAIELQMLAKNVESAATLCPEQRKQAEACPSCRAGAGMIGEVMRDVLGDDLREVTQACVESLHHFGRRSLLCRESMGRALGSIQRIIDVSSDDDS